MLELDLFSWFGRIHLNLGFIVDYQWRVVVPFGLIQILLRCEVGHDIEACGVAYYVESSEHKHTVRSFQALVMACLFLLANTL